MNKLPIVIREATVDDAPFIFNSWLKSYKDSDFARRVPNIIYFAEHHKLIEGLLSHCSIYVACSEEDSNQILGYIVASSFTGTPIIHYIYIKHSFRKLGLATQLISSLSLNKSNMIAVTHWNKYATIASNKYHLVYHPYLLYTKTDVKLKSKLEKIYIEQKIKGNVDGGHKDSN